VPGARGVQGERRGCRSARPAEIRPRTRRMASHTFAGPNFEKIVARAFRRELRVDYDSGLGFRRAAMRVLPTSRLKRP